MLRMLVRRRVPQSSLATAAPVAVVACVINGWSGLCVGVTMMVIIAAVDTVFWIYVLGRTDRNVHRLLRHGYSTSQAQRLGALSVRAQRDTLRARRDSRR